MNEEFEEIYKYKGVPLSQKVLADLIPILFNGRLIESKTILAEAITYHLSKGGEKPNAVRTNSLLSKAMDMLKNKGFSVDCPMHGYWRIGEQLPSEINMNPDTIESHEIIANDEIENIEKPVADYVVGEGKSAVYVYYLPLYLQMAEKEGENFWPCKIGKSDRDPLQRVLSQTATALPEKPHIAIIINTNLPSELEDAIHSTITLRGRKLDSAPGTEWFLTSPKEILEICDFIFQKNKSN